MPVTHTIKFDYEDGEKLTRPITWCGAEIGSTEICYLDLQHVVLAIEQQSSWGSPCPDCLKAAADIINGFLEANDGSNNLEL